MATEHEHIHTEDTGSRGMGTGMIIGLLVVILVLVFLAIYGFNSLGGGVDTGGVTIPSEVDVNVNPGTGGNGGGQ